MTLALIIGGDDPDMPDREWMIDAACSGADPGLWYQQDGGVGSNNHAKAVCATCPVRQTCLDHAIDNGEWWGVWGGLDVRERRNVARRRLGMGVAG